MKTPSMVMLNAAPCNNRKHSTLKISSLTVFASPYKMA
ncbi:MAG: hypothetical protein ACI976_001629 [Aureispira sp.]